MSAPDCAVAGCPNPARFGAPACHRHAGRSGGYCDARLRRPLAPDLARTLARLDAIAHDTQRDALQRADAALALQAAERLAHLRAR